VHIVASLPCYTRANVDRQRGAGVFDKSIGALKMLNELGYGKPGSELRLDLVYNPLGGYLPGSQKDLEADYREHLGGDYGIEFNNLLTVTNVPVKRFHEELRRSGKLEEYFSLLVSSFNPEAAPGIMCRSLLSVSWDGRIYDCDFNQTMEIPVSGKELTVWDIESFGELDAEKIAFAEHCYACTAGGGSSCSGALV